MLRRAQLCSQHCMCICINIFECLYVYMYVLICMLSILEAFMYVSTYIYVGMCVSVLLCVIWHFLPQGCLSPKVMWVWAPLLAQQYLTYSASSACVASLQDRYDIFAEPVSGF